MLRNSTSFFKLIMGAKYKISLISSSPKGQSKKKMQFFLVSISPLFSFFIIFSHYLTAPVNGGKIPETYVLGDVAINCGFQANSTALDGRHWVGETPLLQPQGKSKISASKLLAADPIPYTTARVSSTSFYYTFRLNPGQKFIRLHFYPAPYQGFENSQDFFTVKANSFTLLRNVSASLAADALGVKYFVKEFCLNVNETRSLQIRFFPSQRNSKTSHIHAFVNGIEIISMPTGLYYTLDDNLGARVVDHGNHFYYVDNKTALELVHRMNVGGGSISPVDDTGMFRRWSEDADYLLESGFQQINHFLPAVEYINVPHFVAPAKIYQTSRKFRDNFQLEEKHYFTWKIPVDLGFGYILRLHFCSFVVESTEVIQEGFDVLVQNIIVESKVNLFQLSGGYGIPLYRDYLVMMKGDKSEGKCDLLISIHSVDELAVAVPKGLEIFKLSNTENSLASPNPPCSKTASPFWTLKIQKFLVAFGKLNVGGTVLTIIMVIANVAVYQLKKICESIFWQEEDVQSAPDESSCQHFSLADILSATQNFNDALVIGKGGFGKVYKGFLHGRPGILAIKRLKPDSKQGAHEFWREIETLSKLRHIHLVSLIGYCNDSEEMILVYEYMPRGTVADNLYKAGKDGKEGIPLTWEQRLKICIGAARGLEYLHTGTEHGVIHRDVKDTNILLDENFVAKISDFGLSKLGTTGGTQSQLSTKIKGTVGYLDPDYLMTHKPSTKSDVYAFGIVLLVVLSGRPAVESKFLGETVSLLACFRECMKKGEMNDVIDPCLHGEFSTESLTKFMEAVENCLHPHPKKRPTMAQVVVHLEHALEKQEGSVTSILGGENVLSQTFRAGYESFDFYELQVAPIPENTLWRGNSSKEIENADLVTNLEVVESSEKDRNITPKPLWGRPWVALRNIRKPAKKKDLALQTAHIFSLKDIKAATQNFSNDFFIGQGGYGKVYQGFISGGSEVVAIKRRSSDSKQGASEFRTEVELLSKLQFIHLISFVGCCNEKNELILVYEYMSQGSLDTHLYGGAGNRKNVTSLTWEQRLRICIGAAGGLNYLHEVGVIHRDVKVSSIMLDEQRVPKISSFGLSKMFDLGQSESHVSTRVAGTFGYLDPHYLRTGELTKASDVYSFGIVLLVILSGRRVFDHTFPEEQRHLKSWYETCIAEGNVVKIIDLTLVGKIPSTCLRKFRELIEKCLLEDRKLRPSMAQVVANLEETLVLAQTATHVLLEKLANANIEEQRAAAEELRWLAKENADNRVSIAEAGAIPPLVVLLSSPDSQTQEHSVTALLNLSINEANKGTIVSAGAIPRIIEVLKNGSTEARENAAATLFSLSVVDENKVAIGAAGAIPFLVDLLCHGTPRGKKDAASAIFSLSIYQGNKVRAVRAGVVPSLLELLKDPGVGIVDEVLAMLAILARHPEGKIAIDMSDPVPILAEVIRTGSPGNQENATAILLSLCIGDVQFQRVVIQLGLEEELKLLSENGTDRAKRKAGAVLELLRGIEGGTGVFNDITSSSVRKRILGSAI